MRVSVYALLSIAAAVSAQSAQDAPVVSDSPAGASYVATLPNKEGSTVRGQLSGVSAPDGKGTKFAVAISGLPATGGPFLYHIHEKPVPTDGNCTGTGAHLDPYKRGETPPCDKATPQQCQTGDLSGKFGTVNGTAGAFDYIDPYTSTNPSDPAFFGNLSVVVHFANKTRIACANFTLVAAGVSPSAVPSSGYALPTGTGTFNNTLTTTATGTGGSTLAPSSTYNAPSPSQPAPSSGAGKMIVAGAGVFAGAIALVL